MVKERDMTYRLRTVFIRIAALLFLVMAASSGFAYAAKEAEPVEPIREVHNVGVASETYCFFVTHNVILTPAEVASMTDEELTTAVLERAGLFMKKTNCKKAGHKEITIDEWKKNDGIYLLSTTDLEAIRNASPVEGEPVKFYMDLIVAKDTGNGKEADKADEEGAKEGSEEGSAEEPEKEEIPLYSTYKRTSPKLLFAVVATEEDAKIGEDICKEAQEPKPDIKVEMPVISDPGDVEPEEGLPEYRTINMVDRSGAPIEPTLKEGDPVTLEWIEPADIGKKGEASFFDHIPGGIAGAMAIPAVAAAAVAAVIYTAGRKKKDE